MSEDPFRGTQYRALRVLGAGGMGEVYEVEHEVVGSVLVAKVLRRELADEAGIADRMRVEAQALAALSHPNIVGVTDFARTQDGRPFYVMERLEGSTLGEEFRRRGAFSVEEAVEVVGQVLDGLSAAHRLGLVHRDIKLDNVFLHQTGPNTRVVKLLDFGIAKVVSAAHRRTPAPPTLPTADGAIVGTPRYVSPEQVLGKRIDHRADIYAAGLVLYTLVCGRGPFDHVRRQEDFFVAHLGDDPPAPSDVARQALPNELDAAILRAIRKNPASRFQSAEEFAAALRAIAGRRTAPMGWLETTPSAPPLPSVASSARPDATEPDGSLERRLQEEADVEPTSHARIPSHTEVLPPPAVPADSHALLSTHTAAPPGTPAVPEHTAVVTSEDREPRRALVAYSVAGFVAVAVSSIGLWALDGRTGGLPAVLFLGAAAAAVTARAVLWASR